MDRVAQLARHLRGGSKDLERTKVIWRNAVSGVELEAIDPPVVKATVETSTDPINWLLKQKEIHPDLFVVDRGNGYKYAVISDVSMFEDVLTFDELFGNPITENMSVNKTIFQIPSDQLKRHEQNAISGLRRFLLNHNKEMADQIAHRLVTYMKDVLGEEGEMDLRKLGAAIFWPMTQVLFGEKANRKDAPWMLKAFEDIDNSFGKALRGHKVPEVQAGVSKAYQHFSSMIKEAKNGGCPVGPIIDYYDNVTNHEDPDLTAKFATAAWWGGKGNTLPSTVWTFGMILANPEAKKKAYEEVDTTFADQPGPDGKFDYEKIPYLTAALKEALRLNTYSIAWRQLQKDATIYSQKTGKRYKLPKNMLVGLHFCMRHHDPEVYEDPETFRPERFMPHTGSLSPVVDGKPYAWTPFSAGRHKCSGYPLAMLEIPVVMALMFRHYDMELIDPLPGFDFQQAFGVIGPDSKPARIRYKRRQGSMK